MDLPVVTAARIDLAALTSAEIDRAVRASVADGRSLYAVDAALVDALRPDVILTQDLCAVCAVSSGELATACPVDAEVISLDPRTLDDVAGTVRTLGARLGATAAADAVVDEMWAKIAAVERAVEGLARPRVFVAEWVDPPFCPGHWIPEMVERAGGARVLGDAGEPSHPVTWEQVVAAEPDLVVVAPCGFGAEEAAARAAGLDLPCRVVAVDGDAYYSRPAPASRRRGAPARAPAPSRTRFRIPGCRRSSSSPADASLARLPLRPLRGRGRGRAGLGGEPRSVLVWKVRGLDTVVACLRVGDAHPAILLSGHLEGTRAIPVFRVDDYAVAVERLRAEGVEELRELEIPHGPVRASASTDSGSPCTSSSGRASRRTSRAASTSRRRVR